MTDEPPHQPISEPVRKLVSSATDEQLAWIVGPDRHFYSKEALRAAAAELRRRREEASAEPSPSFQVAAFAFGPLWYFYHGLIGRGVLILLVLVAALVGLQPIAAAAGIPPTLWALLVLLGVGAYCGRYGERDRQESRTQARAAARQSIVERRHDEEPRPRPRARVALLDCLEASEQAVRLLREEGVEASLATLDAAPSERRVAIEVPTSHRDRAAALLQELLSTLERIEEERCGDPSESEGNSPTSATR